MESHPDTTECATSVAPLATSDHPAPCFGYEYPRAPLDQLPEFVYTSSYTASSIKVGIAPEESVEVQCVHEDTEVLIEGDVEFGLREKLATAVTSAHGAYRAYREALALPEGDTPLGFVVHESLIADALQRLTESRRKITDAVRALVSVYSGLAMEPFVSTWNTEYGDSLKGAELTLARAERNSAAFVDRDGRLTLRHIDATNARALLEEIKEIDRLLQHEGNSHDLRKAILYHSHTRTTSTEAMAYGSEELLHPINSWAYLEDEEHWVPERSLLQRRIQESLLSDIHDLAKRLDPGLYALRGNTGTGKSFGVRNHEMFKGAADPKTGEVKGAANPDIPKHELQYTDVDVQGKPYLTSGQVHVEGSIIHQRILRRVVKEHIPAIIVDQRHLRLDDIKRRAKMAEDMHEGLKVLDVDAPLINSYISVLLRDHGTADPVVNANVIDEGFIEARRERGKVQDFVLREPIVENYVLYVRKGTEMHMVAEKKDGVMHYFDQVLNDEATQKVDLERDVAAVRDRLLTAESIAGIANSFPLKYDEITLRLRPFIGKTFAEAIDERARV